MCCQLCLHFVSCLFTFFQDVRPGVDPSLCDKQRQLKRAKLADSLSNQLALRPGPLELIKKNILHTDDPVEQAVKEGQLRFKPTIEGVLGKPVDLPSKYRYSDFPQVLERAHFILSLSFIEFQTVEFKHVSSSTLNWVFRVLDQVIRVFQVFLSSSLAEFEF